MTVVVFRKFVRSAMALLMVTAVMAVSMPVTMAGDGDRIKFRIPLTRTSAEENAKGKAKFEQRSDRRKVNIEVEKVASATSVEFFVDGQSLGTLPIVLGTAELELSTKDGDNPPTMTTSSSVEVRNADTDELILSAN